MTQIWFFISPASVPCHILTEGLEPGGAEARSQTLLLTGMRERCGLTQDMGTLSLECLPLALDMFGALSLLAKA